MSDWISVEDRLPQVGEFCDKTGLEFGCVLVYDGEDVYEEYVHFVRKGYETGEITHWMPLPGPPK